MYSLYRVCLPFWTTATVIPNMTESCSFVQSPSICHCAFNAHYSVRGYKLTNLFFPGLPPSHQECSREGHVQERGHRKNHLVRKGNVFKVLHSLRALEGTTSPRIVTGKHPHQNIRGCGPR
jgi:hypothetical protein